MAKLHDKSIIENIIVPKEGQQDLSCSNNKSNCCPSLGVRTKKERVELVKPILKNLITFIIEKEIKDYLDNLYAKTTGEIIRPDI